VPDPAVKLAASNDPITKSQPKHTGRRAKALAKCRAAVQAQPQGEGVRQVQEARPQAAGL